jgi:propanol-preferring alcohol dehydrogenase
MGAEPVNAGGDAVARIRSLTARGVDVALEMVGLGATMRQAVEVLAPRGRAVIVGIGERVLTVDPYHELVGREIEVLGSNDHTLEEVHELVALTAQGRLDLAPAIAARVPLQDSAINAVLDDLAAFRGGVRTVVVP